jgi:hypothetical protein
VHIYGAPCVGDAYRYTIQPVFNNLTDSVKCHVRQRPVDVLYELFYYVEIPGRDFRTAKTRHIVKSRSPSPGATRHRSRGWVDEEVSYRSHGVFKADYLTVEHDAGLKLDDEFVLQRRGPATDGSKLTGTVTSLPAGDDGSRRRRRQQQSKESDAAFATAVHGAPGSSAEDVVKTAVHEISAGAIYATSVTFDRPFEYSSSKWRTTSDRRRSSDDNRDDDDESTCSDKNVVKFRPPDDARSSLAGDQVPPANASSSDDVGRTSGNAFGDEIQFVEAVVQGRRMNVESPHQPFTYFFTPADNSPYIRFTVHGKCLSRALFIIIFVISPEYKSSCD